MPGFFIFQELYWILWIKLVIFFIKYTVEVFDQYYSIFSWKGNNNAHVYLGNLEEYIQVQSDFPIEGVWSELLKLRDVKYLSHRWKEGSNDDYLFVSTSISQAYEYYEASKSITLNTKPLLIYYSYLNLVKAILFLKNDMKPLEFHGLCNFSDSRSILKLSARVNHGVFYDLSNAFGFEVKKNDVFNMEDFIRNTIELSSDYSTYFNKKPIIIAPKIDILLNGEIQILITKERIFNSSIKRIYQLISKSSSLLEDFKIIQKDNNSLKMKIINKIPKDKLESTGTAFMKNHFIYSVFLNYNSYLNLNPIEKRMPQSVAYFGMLFLLGSLVRYRPVELTKFIDNRKTSVRWFVDKICTISQRVFPNLMLNYLRDANLKYTSTVGW